MRCGFENEFLSQTLWLLHLVWKYVLNFESTVKHGLTRLRLADAEAQVVENLTQRGWSVCPFSNLLDTDTVYNSLWHVYSRLPNQAAAYVEEKEGIKGLEDLLLTRHGVNIAEILQHLQRVADAFLGLKSVCSRIQFLTLDAKSASQPHFGELHYDFEDIQLLKVYILLTDMNEENGGLRFYPSTRALGEDFSKSRALKRNLMPGYPSRTRNFFSAEDVERLAEKVTLAGKAGDVLFFDPSAIHGTVVTLPSTLSRVVCEVRFTAKASISLHNLQLFLEFFFKKCGLARSCLTCI